MGFRAWVVVLGIVAATLAGRETRAALPALCNELGNNVTVTVHTDPGQVVLKAGYSQADLERVQRASGRGGALGGHPIGLTQSDLRTAYKAGVNTINLPSGQFCAALSSVEVALTYSRMDVYIDRRYREGSCEYQAIRYHEEQHVRFFRDALESHKADIHALVEAAARKVPPIVVDRREQAPQILLKQVEATVKPSLDRMSSDSQRLNAAIDTPESYRAVMAQCGNWQP
jgi:hypothetical protein